MKRLIISIFLGVLASNTSLANNACIRIFQSDTEKSSAFKTVQNNIDHASKETEALNLERVQRLGNFLNELKPEQRETLFKEISDYDFAQILSLMRANQPSARVEQVLSKNPGIELVLHDLFALGAAFKGIFNVEDAHNAIPLLLRRLENGFIANNYSQSRRGESRVLISSLKHSIFETVKATIESVRLEYQGITFNRSRGQRIIEKIKNFFDPLYNELVSFIQTSRSFQKQLDRVDTMNSILVENGISKTNRLNLKEHETQAIIDIVLLTPKLAHEMIDVFKDLVGAEFSNTDAVYIHNLNIHKIEKQLKKVNILKYEYAMDDHVIHGLDTMNKVLNTGLKRKGSPERTEKDFKLKTLQLYFGAFERRITRFRNEYFGFTNTSANESYTVERRHVEYYQEQTGTDKDGNPVYTTKSRVYYTADTVTPTFERILSGNYDTGDRNVWGLSDIKNRTLPMVEKERPYRQRFAEHRAMFDQIIENYAKIINEGQQIPNILANINRALDSIKMDIKALEDYVTLEKKSGYDRDIAVIFEGRNKSMLKRYQNMQRALLTLGELMRRRESSLYILFNTYDYTDRLAPIKRQRNIIYLRNTLGVATITGLGIAYVAWPEFQQVTNQKAQQFYDGILNLIRNP